MSRAFLVFLTGFLCLAAATLHAQDEFQNAQMPDIRGRLAAIQQAPDPAPPPDSNRDRLWDIIQCLNGQTPAVQASPTSPIHVCGGTVLHKALDQDPVVLRDDKMSACAVNANAKETDPRSYSYVHALAVPLARMTGVEQEEGRPQGIWDLAWRKAALYVPEANDIVLAANPKIWRNQDQLHIHLLRLKPGAKDEILHPQPGSRRVPPTYIDRLSGSPDPVWPAAERNADELAARLGTAPGLKSGAFGVTVIYDEERKQYAVIASEGSPERAFGTLCPVSE